MHKFNFLICYDISDEKRLRKVAKELEKVSIRIQKSIFYYPDASKDEITILVEALDNIISKDEDDIRIYKIDINHSLNLKSGIDLNNPNILE